MWVDQENIRVVIEATLCCSDESQAFQNTYTFLPGALHTGSRYVARWGAAGIVTLANSARRFGAVSFSDWRALCLGGKDPQVSSWTALRSRPPRVRALRSSSTATSSERESWSGACRRHPVIRVCPTDLPFSGLVPSVSEDQVRRTAGSAAVATSFIHSNRLPRPLTFVDATPVRMASIVSSTTLAISPADTRHSEISSFGPPQNELGRSAHSDSTRIQYRSQNSIALNGPSAMSPLSASTLAGSQL